MDVTLTCLHLTAYLVLALALPLPRLRGAATLVLALAAVAGIAAGLMAPGERTLETVHTYAAYDGEKGMEVSMVRFATGTFTAPGWQWPLPFALFAAFWLTVLFGAKDRPLGRPWLWPLLFGWTATAAWLGMQWLAAPGPVVQPIGLDRFLWPAGLAASLLAARTATKALPLFVTVSGTILLARLPAALFSKFASEARLGSCLDVSTVGTSPARTIVNPMTQMQFENPFVANSSEHQFWTIWLEHVIFFPAIHLMSLFGIAFSAWMFHRHGAEERR
ncbi:MAG: hypothetical protein ACK501_23345 [Planctomycetota bacterium]|jgi:hypothetical protein